LTTHLDDHDLDDHDLDDHDLDDHDEPIDFHLNLLLAVF